MKRGWIAWDPTELPREAFDSRLKEIRRHLAARELSALAVYTDVWRSNRVRHFSNFMPYWNRAILVIPREYKPVLLCGLSPRVYPWIHSVTILEEILPSPNLAQRLLQLCTEKGWTRIGALDFTQFQYDLYTQLAAGPVQIADLSIPLEPDQWELAMHRRAAEMAREGLAEEMPAAVGLTDHAFTGRLERRFRRAGAEDLIVLVSKGDTPPLPANGAILGESFSVSVALEYRGHWAKVVRSPVAHAPSLPADAQKENLSGLYPYETGPAPVFAARWESGHNGRRVFYGDTYRQTIAGAELL
jgi:hypothetical protein